MSRQIPTDGPLSEEDRAYLIMRGQDQRVAWFDTAFPAAAPAAPAAEVEEEGDDYDEWTVAQLNAEIAKRNAASVEQIVPASTKKADLIEALRTDDAADEADEDDDEDDDEDES